jgi:hypothetical protein
MLCTPMYDKRKFEVILVVRIHYCLNNVFLHRESIRMLYNY